MSTQSTLPVNPLLEFLHLRYASSVHQLCMDCASRFLARLSLLRHIKRPVSLTGLRTLGTG